MKNSDKDLKNTIRETPDDMLETTLYNSSGLYTEIEKWIYGDRTDNKTPCKIKRYLDNKGVTIEDLQVKIILAAFKQKIVHGKFDEIKLIESFKIQQKQREESELRIKTSDTINGIYIPKDIYDCMRHMAKECPDSVKIKIKNKPENEYVGHNHFDTGLFIRNSWIRDNTRLTYYFHDLNVYNPDDISPIILRCFHRFLSGKDIKFEEQVQETVERLEQNTLKEEEYSRQNYEKYYNVGDTLYYGYRNSGMRFDYDKKVDKHCLCKGLIVKKDNKKNKIKIRLLNICEKEGIILDADRQKAYNIENSSFEYPEGTKFIIMNAGDSKWFDIGDINWFTPDIIDSF